MKLYSLPNTFHKKYILEGLKTQTTNKTLPISGENIGEYVYDLGQVEVILNQTLNAKYIKEQTDKFDSTKTDQCKQHSKVV